MSRSSSTLLVWRRHPGYIGAYLCDLLLATGLGLTALLSDDQRFTAPAYAQVRYAGVMTWGGVLAALAVALVVAVFTNARVTMVVLAVSAVIYWTLAVYFLLSAENDLKASWWGTIFAGVIGFWQLTQANEYRRVQL